MAGPLGMGHPKGKGEDTFEGEKGQSQNNKATKGPSSATHFPQKCLLSVR